MLEEAAKEAQKEVEVLKALAEKKEAKAIEAVTSGLV